MNTTVVADHYLPVPAPAPRRYRLRRWLAIAAFAMIAPLAHAGTAEYNLVNVKLGGSATVDRVSQATTTELVNAVLAVIAENPRINAGTIAGEALKRAGSAAPDAGLQIANAVISAYPNGLPLSTKTLTLPAFVTQAIKTTASGVGLNVNQVPGFVQPFVASNGDAITYAVSVRTSKASVSAVLNGRALELTTDAEKIALTNLAITDRNLAAAIQEATAGVASTVTDVVGYTNALVTNAANLRNVLKIVPGVVAGQPTAAGVVTEAAFAAFDSQGTLSPIVKGAATLAKSVGTIADIEQIQRVGTAIATRVGSNVIKYSSINAIATTLAKAIVAKPLAITGANRNANKVDELGELAAYTLGAVFTSVDFLKAPEKNLAALVKAILSGAKSTYGPSQTDVASYVIGSIALTISNLSNTDPLRARLIAYLQLPATAKAFGGTALASLVTAAIADGLAGAPGRFENGLDVAAGNLTDAETNSRNL